MALRVGPLVRAVSPTRAVIWAELSTAQVVTFHISSFDNPTTMPIQLTASPICVGGRYYVAPLIYDLQPSTWYYYQMIIPDSASDLPESTNPTRMCFRTLDAARDEPSCSLRIAYGSCRRLTRPDEDTLESLGTWLTDHFEEREEVWPHLLLLIGDQIYADEPPPALLASYPHLHGGAVSFEDFATIYTYAWTCTAGTRQALALLPSFMIFDDHEITNNWNLSPTWRAMAIARGREQLLIDGMVAYWLYQGWGNLLERQPGQHPLLDILLTAEQNGEDALEPLRNCVHAEVHGQHNLPWHYEIPSTPPIFVTNTRSGRSAIFDNDQTTNRASTRIMDQEQMADLHSWLQRPRSHPALLASSVPVLLPPLIGLAEYMMGVRPWQKSSLSPLRWLGGQLARIQMRIAYATSFDHWPAFFETWHELIRLLDDYSDDVLIFSGDVHFSYAVEGYRSRQTGAHIYQLVSTPIENTLEGGNLRLVTSQSYLARSSYGGLHTRILPLRAVNKEAHMKRHLLFQNTIAIVTLRPQTGSHYQITQDYLSNGDGRLQVVASTYIRS